MSEAREDLPQARAPLPPIPAPAVQQAAGQGATIYQFPSMPTAAPPATANAAPPLATSSQVIPTALQPLVSKIKGGESGNRNVLYGNDPVPPGNVIPGAIGPTGKPTHAFSEWQFEPGTWNDAAKAFRQVGWVLNKDDPSDRDRAGLWVARRDYKAKTGRDLDQDAKAGKIDEGALHATWTSIRPQYAAAREERYAAGSSDLQGIAAETHKIMEEIGKTGRDPKMFNMLQEARQKMAEYEERALKLQEEGPKNDPRDLMQRMGGVATVIGILGGLLTKQPLMASLNAGGAAMEAYNKQDEAAYKANVDQWKFHIETLQRMGQIQHDLIRDTLADEKLDSGEKMSRLQAMLSALGNERLAVSAQLGDQRALEAHRDSIAEKNQSLAERIREFDAHYGPNATATKAGKVTTYEITDKDGKKTQESLQQGQRPGEFFKAETGERFTPPEGSKMEALTPSAGRQAATQMARVIGAGNEMAATLSNLVELPITSSIGRFMGVPNVQPHEMGEAVRRSLANEITSDEVKSLLYSSQGVPRFIATLEAFGTATGLVGLSEQARGSLPQAGDNGYQVLRKYAELAQIIERSVETAKTLPGVSDDQKKLLDKIVRETRESVPYTVKDINALERNPSDESVKSFADRVGATGASRQGSIPQAAIDKLKAHPDKREDFDAIFGAGAAAKVLGQ